MFICDYPVISEHVNGLYDKPKRTDLMIKTISNPDSREGCREINGKNNFNSFNTIYIVWFSVVLDKIAKYKRIMVTSLTTVKEKTVAQGSKRSLKTTILIVLQPNISASHLLTSKMKCSLVH